ncbi:unnamed protein product [Schistosoma turkestanicum]|nr:unnamed protein product [Schistosoma turkestanicum]
MVMKRFSEPSSPNSNHDEGGIENNDHMIDSTVIPIGYTLLGSEIVHMANDNNDGDDSDDDDDDDLQDNNHDNREILNDNLSDNENDELEVSQQHGSCIQSVEYVNHVGADVDDGEGNSGSINLQLDVDHLLNRHLNRTEFEPRGPFTATDLCTNLNDDSSHIELWNQNTPASTSQITITPDEADKIKMYMSNFQLPISQYPTWATQIPEELWKAKLLEKIEHNYK